MGHVSVGTPSSGVLWLCGTGTRHQRTDGWWIDEEDGWYKRWFLYKVHSLISVSFFLVSPVPMLTP